MYHSTRDPRTRQVRPPLPQADFADSFALPFEALPPSDLSGALLSDLLSLELSDLLEPFEEDPPDERL